MLTVTLLFTAVFSACVLVLTGRAARTNELGERRIRELEREAAERSVAEQALRENEELFRMLSTASPVGIYRIDAGGNVVYTNPRWQEITGLTLAESLGDGWARALHPDDQERVLSAWARVRREAPAEFSIDFRFVRPQGEVRWVTARTAAVRSPAGKLIAFVGTTEDVTEQRRFDQALRASEERYRALAEQSSDFISRHDVSGRITYASAACHVLTGYAPDELVGRSIYEFIHPADLESVRGQLRTAAERRGGSTATYRIRRNDGEIVWFESSLRVLYDSTTHRPTEIVAVSRDVSEHKQVERMRQDMVAMLSHDLKNPLTAVLGFAELLHDMPADDPQREDFLSRIEANAHSALGLAINFVDASQIDSGSLEPRLEPVFLNEIVEHVIDQQESRARVKHVDLAAELDRAEPMAYLDRRLLDRVIANLLNNAIKFSPARRRVLVSTASEDGRVLVRVRDQGPGVPQEQRPRLFQRFSDMRTNRSDSTGLGLFIVKTLVDAQGGAVRVDFPDEGGSVFEVSFPAGNDPR